jgi:hypothetical protein
MTWTELERDDLRELLVPRINAIDQNGRILFVVPLCIDADEFGSREAMAIEMGSDCTTIIKSSEACHCSPERPNSLPQEPELLIIDYPHV